MAKTWILLILSALNACLSTFSNTTRVLTPPFAIQGALGSSTGLHLQNASAQHADVSLRTGSSCNYQCATTANISPPHWGSRHRTSVPGDQSRKANCFEYDINYHGYDVQKLEDGTIRHPHACQHMCAQTPGCAYWTYVPETSTCYLKNQGALQGKTCRSFAVSGPRTCPLTYDSCYEVDIDYYGADEKSFADHMVRTAEECHLLCLAFPACHFWTWVSAQRNCYLKNQRAPSGRLHAPGKISGPRHCVATFPAASGGSHEQGCGDRTCYEDGCYDYNVLYTGTSIEDNTAIHDPLDCQCLCQRHPSCGGFSYLPTEKKCMLKPSQGTTIFQTDAVSGPKFCYTPDCTIRDVEYYGRNIANSSASSFPVCHKLCQSNSLCSAVTFHEASKQCSLVQRAEYVRGFVSGPRRCTSAGREYNDRRGPATATGVAYVDSHGDSFCHDTGFAYTSKPFSVKHSNSAELCQRHCQIDSRCHFFTYFLFAQTCLLHGNESQRVPNDTAASGPRVCPPSTTACFYEGVEVYGKEVGKCTTDDATACQQSCQRNEHCSFFAYDTRSKLCSQRQHRGPANGTTSAPVFCGIHDDDVIIRHERPKGLEMSDSAGLRIPTPTEPPKADCVDVGLHYDSVLLEETVTESSRECQQKCEEEETCSVFSFFRDTGICTLHFTEGNQLLRQEAVSGPWKCGGKPRTPDCLVLGEYEGERILQDELEITLTTFEPPADCLLLCLRTEGCKFFTHGKQYPSCKLFRSISGLKGSRFSVSGPTNCTTTDHNPCKQEGVACSGDNVGTQTIENSVDDCRAKCQKEPLCNFYSYNETDKECSLLENIGEKYTDSSAVCGAKYCFTPTFAPYAFNFASFYTSEFTYTNAGSYQECFKLCEENPTCRFFTFPNKGNECRLHKRPGLSKEDEELRGVSGPVHFTKQTVLEACVSFDSRYVGEEDQALDNIENVVACKQSCTNSSQCRFFTYLEDDKSCTLFKSRRRITRQPNAASGWRECPANELCTPANALHSRKYASLAVGNQKSTTCEIFCRYNEECNVWGYYLSEKRCFTSVILEAAPLHISGPLPCDDKVHPLWLSVWGGPVPKADNQLSTSCFANHSQASVEDCQRACQRQWNCRSFSFSAADGQCAFYETNTAPAQEKGDVSCPAWHSPPPFSCRVENVTVRGDSTMEQKTVSVEECVALCVRTSGSTYYTFDTVTNHCSCGFHVKDTNVTGAVGMKACMS